MDPAVLSKLAGLTAFAFVSAVTPGPNNALLWASGAQFGLRRTVPQIAGTDLGLGVMATLLASGLAVVLTTLPAVGLALRVAGSLYLLYLAYQIAFSGAIDRTHLARPLSLVQAAAFQFVNPKAWIFALSAVSLFRPPGLPAAIAYGLVVVTVMIVVVPCATVWAAGGSVISRLLTGARARRALGIALGGLLVGTVVDLWL